MKVAATTPTKIDFDALKGIPAYHCADYEARQLERKRVAYELLLERYHKLLLMEEEGITVMVTMTTHSGSMTVHGDRQFEPMDYLNTLSTQLDKLAIEILALHQKQQTTGIDNDNRDEVADNLLRRKALALCRPAAMITETGINATQESQAA